VGNGDEALVSGYHVVEDFDGRQFHSEKPPQKAATSPVVSLTAPKARVLNVKSDYL
jgi:hypothetical protein